MPDRPSNTPVAFVYVTDRERALAFYRDVLGCTPLSADNYGDTLDLGGGRLRTVVMPDHKPSEHPVLGWAVDDVDATVDALAARGVTFQVYEGMGQDARGVWTSPDGATKLAFFNDPDGNALSLSQGD